MIDRRITYCIPTKNNLRYLKNSINSIRENSSTEYDIVVFVDADNDGTIDWLNENGIRYTTNETNEPKGIAYGYNRCIEVANTPIVCMFHADMYMGKGFDMAILKYLKPLTVVSGTRIEPPLHPSGLEKIVKDFGMYPEDFKKAEFDEYVADMIEHSKDVTTQGIFAPWAIYKEDITSIGMHDESFHSYHEDSDIFNRFILNDYQIVQTWEALVYHLTCRGGQFQDGIDKVTTDVVFHKMKNNAFRNYVRKWGCFVKNNEYQYPIIPHTYNVKFKVTNCDIKFLEILEPWCGNIDLDMSDSDIATYIEYEQSNTNINLKDKINNKNSDNDIVVKFNAKELSNDSFQFITQLSEIFDANELECGNYQFGIYNIEVKKIHHLENNLINCNN